MNHEKAKLERQIWLIGQGALARPDGAAILRWPRRRPLRSARSRMAGTVSRCCTPRRRASVRSISASCPGRAASRRAEMAKPGALDVRVPARRRRDRHRARRVHGLHRHAWRPRRASRGCHSARRGLHGKIRPLREHGRPRADGGARRVPAGRCARGLGDLARAVGRARAKAALRLAGRPARRAVQGSFRISRASIRSRRATQPTSKSSPAAARPPTKRRSVRLSPTSISPIRSRARPPSWPSAPLWRAATAR